MKRKIYLALCLKYFVFLLFFQITAKMVLSQDTNQHVISGTVRDTSGFLQGVSVFEKNTSNATQTAKNGTFTITTTKPNPVLVFQSMGYQLKEVSVEGRSDIEVVLISATNELSNVTVTALGIARSKRSIGYSIAEVKSDNLVKAANQNVLKSLDGKVSGVNIVSLSSDPTSSVLVNIRGTTAMPSLSSGADVSLRSQPLYVIDGVPVGTQTFTPKDGVDFGNILSQLNPEDIESVTILKGGSAGALYGAEGGNGVVMITTKSGKGGRKGLGVSYTTSYTWEQPYQFIEQQMEFGQGERAFEWQFDNTDTWGNKLDGSFSADYWDTKEQQWKNKPMVSSFENRMQAFLQTGNTFSNNLNVQGNYDRGAFRLSLSNMDNVGVMPNTKTDQLGITLNSEYLLTKNIRLSVNSSYIRTNTPNKANSTGSNSVINDLLFNFPSNLQPLSEMKDYWLKGYENVQQNGAIMDLNSVDVLADNPWWSAYEKIHRFTRDNYFGKLQLDWRFSNKWSLLLRTGMESVKEEYELRQSWGETNLADKFDNGDGQYVTGNNSSLLVNSDAILTYNNNFGKFSVNVSGGGNYAYSNNNSIEANTTPV